MRIRKLALIGYGSIGRSIVDQLSRIAEVRLVAVMMRRRQLEQGGFAFPAGVLTTDNFDEVLRLAPDVVVEAAGQEAVSQYGAVILFHGAEFMVLSIGALADETVTAALVSAAKCGGGRICVPAGALAGFDGLLSLREAGLSSVIYRATKPVAAWRGTPAELRGNLTELLEPTVVFSGSAREAAVRFPKNANLAVAVAIAGVGLDRTKVELVADPSASQNTGHLIAESDGTRLEVTVTNRGFESNPKSSRISGFSVIAALANQASLIRFQ